MHFSNRLLGGGLGAGGVGLNAGLGYPGLGVPLNGGIGQQIRYQEISSVPVGFLQQGYPGMYIYTRSHYSGYYPELEGWLDSDIMV